MAKEEVQFEPVRLSSVFDVLDGIAWLDDPTNNDLAQFSGVDPRTSKKVIKNCLQIGIIDEISDDYFVLTVPYPFKGSEEQKRAVLRESIFNMPLIVNLRQFLKLGDSLKDGLRKAATMQEIKNYEKKSFDPLIKWASKLDALSLDLNQEDFIEAGVKHKQERHKKPEKQSVVFLSHSSKDKPFIRQLAADLNKEDILVWLDEKQIKVGDSINDKISQGLAESDYFIIALSDNSVESDWVKKELNSALISEMESKDIKVLPIKLTDCELPRLINDKKYADFSGSYKSGFNQLIEAIK